MSLARSPTPGSSCISPLLGFRFWLPARNTAHRRDRDRVDQDGVPVVGAEEEDHGGLLNEVPRYSHWHTLTGRDCPPCRPGSRERQSSPYHDEEDAPSGLPEYLIQYRVSGPWTPDIDWQGRDRDVARRWMNGVDCRRGLAPVRVGSTKG